MKMKNYLFMLATLFSAAIGFTACSSEEDVAGSEEDRGVVKADFTISFPQQMSGITRQSTEIVQGQTTPVFRGISGIELMPFTAAKSDVSGESTIPSSINLYAGSVGKQGASSATANTIDAQYALYTKSNSHLYTDIEIAIGTRAFMFYGKAIDATPATGSNANATNGSLVKSVTPSGTTLNDISFSLTDITTATVDAQATAIAGYLTNIAKATAGGETMLTYFPNFTNLKAGSYTSMKAVVQAVYTSLYNNTDALSTAIKTAILAGYTPSGASAKTITVVENGTTPGKLDFTSEYTYPRNLYLPDGAAHINWNTSTNAFDVVITNDVGLNISAINDYTYPAALYYYGLSNIWAVPAPMSGYYNDDKSWADIVKDYTDRTDESEMVQSTTRSIAIRDEVQYAVGRLDVTVQSNGGTGELADNSGSNTKIQLGTNGANFPITGILVGNQKAVKYNFETNTSAAAKTIYDSQMPTGATLYPGSPTVKTHTLVLQTVDANSNDDTNANVPIAIEFENAGNQIIVGKGNELIYPGTRFYLIGTLRPYENETQKYVGTETPIKKAFVQDYITTANFTVESFKNAYHTLPDLRTPSLEIGLSVDLTWKSGITQNITIQ